jgi:hypothetical protein
MRIPEVKDALAEVAADPRVPADLAARIKSLADELRRRRPRTVAEPRSTPTTPLMMNAIRHYHAAHPDKPQTEIARIFNVNPGRVSEALRGKRT